METYRNKKIEEKTAEMVKTMVKIVHDKNDVVSNGNRSTGEAKSPSTMAPKMTKTGGLTSSVLLISPNSATPNTLMREVNQKSKIDNEAFKIKLKSRYQKRESRTIKMIAPKVPPL